MRLAQTSIVYFLTRVGSSVVGFLATVYFARVLGSEVLGVYFLALALVAWLKIGSNAGITVAITKRVSERKDVNAHVLAGLILTTFAFTMIASGVFLFRHQVNQYLGEPLYHLVILLLGVSVAYGYVGAVLRGERLVHVQGLLGFAQTMVRCSFQVAAVFFGMGLTGLLLGEAAAFALIAVGGVGLLLTYFRRSVSLELPERRHFRSVIGYARYSWLGTLKGRSFNLMDTIVLGFFVSPGLIGIYSIAWNISSILDLFAKSLSTSLFPEMSKLSSDSELEQVSDHLGNALAYAGLFIIPGFVGAIVVGEGVLNLYGEEFREGYYVLVILVAATLVHSYHKQFVTTIDALDRPEITFRVNAFFVITNIGLNLVLVYFFGWIGAAVATFVSVFLSLVYAYRSLSSILAFTVPVREIGREVVAAVAMGGMVYTVVLVLQSQGVNTLRFLPVLTAVGIGAGSYFGILFLLSGKFRDMVSSNLPVDVRI